MVNDPSGGILGREQRDRYDSFRTAAAVKELRKMNF